MKKYYSLFCVLIVAILSLALFLNCGNTATTQAEATNISLEASYSKIFTASDNDFNVDTAFSNATTSFNLSLARASCTLAVTSSEYRFWKEVRELHRHYGFKAFTNHSCSSVPGKPSYATSFFTGYRQYEHNVRDARIYLINVTDTSINPYGGASVDFLNSKTNAVLDYNSDDALTFTVEAERIYNDIAADLENHTSDFNDVIIWVTGWGRGGSVGNALAKRLIDVYGTSRVAAYLFGVGNISKNALTDNSSKYNSIFNINNLDDVSTYLPLRSWGYGRWGVDINLGLPTDATARATLKSQLNAKYIQVTANSDRNRDSHLDENYPFFSDSECNGVAISGIIQNIDTTVGGGGGSTVYDYYNTPLSMRDYSSIANMLVKKTSKISIVVYDLLDQLLDFIYADDFATDDIIDWFLMMKASIDEQCDGTELINFILKHGYHLENVTNELIERLTSDAKFAVEELIVNRLPEAYFVWMDIANPALGITNLASLPQTSSSCVDTMSSNGCFIGCGRGLYTDQTFTATPTGDNMGYDISFYYTDTKTPCRTYGTCFLLVPQPSGVTDGASPYYEIGDDECYVPTYEYNQTNKTYAIYYILNPNMRLRWKTIVSQPYARTDLVYNGNSQFLIHNYDNTYYTCNFLEATYAGTHNIICTLKDSKRSQWAIGNESPTLQFKVVLKRLRVVVTALPVTFTYNGNEQTVVNGEYKIGDLAPGDDLVSIKVTGSAANAGVYARQIMPSDVIIRNADTGEERQNNYNLIYNGGTLTILPQTVEIPTVVTGQVYDGQPHNMITPLSDLYSSTGATATIPQTTTTICSLTDTANYVWSDNTTASKSFTWTIAPRPLTITAADYAEIYTGESISPPTNEYTVDGLVSGHKISNITITGSATNGGVYQNLIMPSNVVITDYSETNRTNYYAITYKGGTLTIYGYSELVISKAPTKLVYCEDEVFDDSGVILMVKYSNNTLKRITDYTVDKTSPLTPQDLYMTFAYSGISVKQSITVIGHIYSAPQYVWAQNSSTCTAVMLCTEPKHTNCRKMETADAVLASSQIASCGEDGYMRYTVDFTNPAFVQQEKIINLGTLSHEIIDWTVVKPASCTESGLKIKECINCRLKTDEMVLTVLGHDFGNWEVSVTPTCTYAGEEKRVCARCLLEEQNELSILEHQFSEEWTIDIQASCVAEGSKSHHCLNCTTTKDVTILAKTAHVFSGWELVSSPTCTSSGEERSHCLGCNKSERREIKALSHDFSTQWTIDEETTCQKAGQKSRHCSRCTQVTEITVIPKLEHTPGEWEIIEPATCSVAGRKIRTCTVCLETIDDEVISFSGHTAGEWAVTKEPSCIEKGEKQKVCIYCESVVDSEVLDYVPHISGEPVVIEEATCGTDGWTETCCTVCHMPVYQDRIPATNQHEWGYNVTLGATHMTEGIMEKTCDVCGKVEEEPIPTLEEHEYTSWESIAGDNNRHYKICTCGTKTPESHTWNRVASVLVVTENDEIQATYRCIRCNYTKTQIISGSVKEKFQAHLYTFSQKIANGKVKATEENYNALAKIAEYYNGLSNKEKKELSASVEQLTAYIDSYNSGAEKENTELQEANNNILGAFSALLLPFAYLLWWLKRKFF